MAHTAWSWAPRAGVQGCVCHSSAASLATEAGGEGYNKGRDVQQTQPRASCLQGQSRTRRPPRPSPWHGEKRERRSRVDRTGAGGGAVAATHSKMSSTDRGSGSAPGAGRPGAPAGNGCSGVGRREPAREPNKVQSSRSSSAARACGGSRGGSRWWPSPSGNCRCMGCAMAAEGRGERNGADEGSVLSGADVTG